jgi:hypothetical protein
MLFYWYSLATRIPLQVKYHLEIGCRKMQYHHSRNPDLSKTLSEIDFFGSVFFESTLTDISQPLPIRCLGITCQKCYTETSKTPAMAGYSGLLLFGFEEFQERFIRLVFCN